MQNIVGSGSRADRLIQEEKQRDHKRDFTDPNKQFVRKGGWVPAAKERLAKVKKTGSGFLKYFTLCAGNAIDVYWFYLAENLISYNGIEFPEVVYCERSQDVFEEVARKLGRTVGFLADIEELILDTNTEDSKNFYLQLPFDVYNFDFSGLCFPKYDPPFSKTLKSIVTLINLMAEPKYQHSFDIFLTFRTQRSQENEEAIKTLRHNLMDNIRTFPEFNKIITKQYGEMFIDLEKKYHEFLLITLPKYLGRIACDLGFKVKVTHRFFYSRPNRRKSEYKIISFGLSFEWIGKNSNINRTLRQKVPNNEITIDAYHSMMMNLLNNHIGNVDTILFDRQEYSREVQELLKTVEKK